MSLPKAQLVDPQGNMNLPGMTATGVVTATSLKGVSTGSVTNLTGSPDLDVGIVTGSSFVGDGTGHAANITGTPQLSLGIATATSFVGDAVGKAAGLTGTPNLNVGLITATSFVGFVTGDVTGNISGLAASITPGSNLGLGVCTAIQYHGDGSGLTGAGSSAYIAQEITVSGDETIIDLSDGNVIYFDQSSTGNTTVGFASTSPAEQVTFIRKTAPNTTSWNISYATGGVDFDRTNDYLNTTSSSSDFTMGTGDFTVECWVYIHDVTVINGFWQISNTSGGLATDYGDTLAVAWDHQAGEGWQIYGAGTYSKTGLNVYPPSNNEWHHTAYVRSSGVSTLYLDGVAIITLSDSHDYDGTYIAIGGYYSASYLLDGVISNFRVVKGTAVYKSNFVPPTAALTNITNTKLLCCQSSSSTTTAAVTPQTLNAQGDPTAGAQTIASTGSLTLRDYTINWPDRVKWNGGSAPTLFTDSQSSAFQIFHLTTVDTGASYQAWEEMKNDPEGPYGLFGWGSNVTAAYGQLGQNDNVSQSSPTQVGTEETWTNGVAIGHHEQATVGFIKTDGTLWMWGSNYNSGQLGQNQATAQLDGKSSPTQIPGTTWATVSCGDKCEIMTKTDGTMWSLGINEQGQLGLNDIVNRSSPTQIPGTDWGNSKIWGNGGRVIKSDSTLWVWGSGWGGSLGLNSWAQYSSPVQLPGSWSDITAGGTNLGVKTNGTLWSWGYTSNGISGLNISAPRRSSPTQIGTDSDWGSKIFVGATEAGALKADGSLWMWGANSYGNLAQNNATARSSPVQVGTSTDWADAAIGRYYTVATKTNGTLWAWGFNVQGQSGSGTTPAGGGHNYSSPIQVGTDTGWANPYVTREGSWALRQL